MPPYKYRARDKQGKSYTGKLEATSPEAAGDKLQMLGFIPVAIARQNPILSNLRTALGSNFKKISPADINLFSRQLSVLLDAGVPLLQGLDSISQQIENQQFKSVINELITDIRSGTSFSGALEKFPSHFEVLYVNIIKAGEASGTLDTALERLATLGEHEEEMHSRIRSATMYPVIVICALSLAFLILVNFVLPRFAKIFSRFHTKLPLPTRILLGINYVSQHYGVLIFILILLAIVGFRQFIKTRSGRFWFDSLKLKLLVFGPLLTKIMLSRFTRITSGLLKSGIPIIQTIELVSKTVNNVILARAIEDIKLSINAGKGMSETMKQNKLFPPIVVQMVAIGEETGKLDDLLVKVSDYFDYQANYIIANLTTLLEPILLVVLGSGVLFMALAIFLPMWNLIYLFKR